MNKKITLLFMLICVQIGYAQQSNPLGTNESLFARQTVPTPESAALIKHVNYPVNYSAGLVDIKIPLYEVKSGDLSWPIYLSYHASGVKLNEPSGWVGQGWSIHSEPMINRSIQGKRDNEWSRDFTCDFDKTKGYANSTYLYYLTQGFTDEEPDIYYYRLAEKSGKFTYVMEPVDSTRKYMSIPYENLRIQREDEMFQIIDDNGTRYEFGGAVEQSGVNLYRTGWKGSKILSANGNDHISFTYNTSYSSQTRTFSDNIVVIDLFNIRTGPLEKHRKNLLGYGVESVPDELMESPIVYSTTNDEIMSYQLNDSGNLIEDTPAGIWHTSDRWVSTHTKVVSEISFAQGKVVFHPNTAYPHRLSRITVHDSQGNIIKDIRFNYQDIQSRFYLTSLEFVGQAAGSGEKYQFDYYDWYMIPGLDSKSFDHWGYSNGVNRDATETLVPYREIDCSRETADFNKTSITLKIGSSLSREANESAMIRGTLSAITYPTGGKDHFLYEAHRYKDANGEVKIAGGLRIKEIRTTNDDQSEKIRTFRYGINEDGIGKELRIFHPDDYMFEQTKYYTDPLTFYCDSRGCYYIPEDGYVTARFRTFFCNSMALPYDGGSSVMYDYVTEYDGTPVSNNGKTVYQYDIMDRTEDPFEGTSIRRNSHLGWQFGHLLNKTIYKNNNGQYVPVEKEENTWSRYDKLFGKVIVGEAFDGKIIRPKINGSTLGIEILYNELWYSQTAVDVRSKLLKSTNHYTYLNNEIVCKTTAYEYGNAKHTYLTKQTESSSEGGACVMEFKRPHDYGNAAPYNEMVQRNIVSPIIKKTYIRDGKKAELETPYAKFHSSLYMPASLVQYHNGETAPDTRVSYDYYANGKIKQATKDGLEDDVCLWGYNHQYIVAKIENATYDQVKTAIGGESIIINISDESSLSSNSLYKLNLLRSQLPHARVIVYTYNPLVGVSSVTDPRGFTTYYDYDEFGRLLKVYIVNDNKTEVLERYDYHYADE